MQHALPPLYLWWAMRTCTYAHVPSISLGIWVGVPVTRVQGVVWVRAPCLGPLSSGAVKEGCGVVREGVQNTDADADGGMHALGAVGYA